LAVTGTDSSAKARAFWRRNLVIVGVLLVGWFVVSLGAGVLFVDALDRYRIGGFKVGFWFAQQGSIFAFVLLTFTYVVLMNRLDRKFGLSGDAPSSEKDANDGGTEPRS
jgi:putative solute:sodium symporter small subunit